MSAFDVVRILLEQNPIEEASVRRPPRSSRWVAVITGIEPGTQIARSTGLTDRDAAMTQARKWEQASRLERARRNASSQPRSNHSRPRRDALLTQVEVATILGLSERAVRSIEQRALSKLRRHPLLRKLWAEYVSQAAVEETMAVLEPEEISALLSLARTDHELSVLMKVVRLVLADP